MKFKEFVNTGKLEKFRKIKFDLTENDSNMDDFMKDISPELIELRNVLNQNLKKGYRGKLKIDFLTEDLIDTHINKHKKNLKNKFQKELLEANDKIAKVKTKIEKKISTELREKQ